jgi:peptidoglycan hydrolase CwlO-like protein
MKGRSASLVLGAFARFANSEDGPVTRVVSLLEELQGKIEADGEAEQKVYDKFACWCETTTGRKAAAITEAREELKQLGTTILKLKGTIATRAAEIKELIADIKDNEEAQKKATKIRAKENAAYMAERAETQQAAAAMEKALTVLSSNTLLEVSSILRKAQHVHLNAKQSESLQLLEQEGRTGAAYAPQSATIQGILGDMYETFTKSLEKAEHNEATLHRNFEKLMKTKQDELLTMQETLSKKQSEKAEAETMLADATQNYDDTEAQMHGDVKFFDTTKESCEKKSEEWSERKRLRNDELEGISEALKILTSDEARELFSKSIKPGRGTGTFLQVAQVQVHEENPVSAAFDILKRDAQRSHSVRLAALAANVHALGRQGKSGHFEDVLNSIDTLLDTLKQEQKDDDNKASECKEEFQDLTSKIEDLSWKIDKNEAKFKSLKRWLQRRSRRRTKLWRSCKKLARTLKT